jgi:hypothetical protein
VGDSCRFRGLVGGPDTIATVGLKGEDVVTGRASLTKLQHVSLGAAEPTRRGKSLEPRIGS